MNTFFYDFQTAGAVDVIVTVDGNSVTSPTQYTYDASATPTISSVSPVTIGAAGIYHIL